MSKYNDKLKFQVETKISKYGNIIKHDIDKYIDDRAKSLFLDEVWKKTKVEKMKNNYNNSIRHSYTVDTQNSNSYYNHQFSYGTPSTATNYTIQTTGDYNTYVGVNWNKVTLQDIAIQSDRLSLAPGVKEIELPDGTILEMDELGNFKIVDKDAKVVYQANRNKEFNPFLNANDLLGEYVDFLGNHGVDAIGILRSPIELFVTWLIHKAAEADGDEIPLGAVKPEEHPLFEQLLFGQIVFLPPRKLLLAPKQNWNERCKWCGKFISMQKCQCQIFFCDPEHMTRFAEKQSVNF